MESFNKNIAEPVQEKIEQAADKIADAVAPEPTVTEQVQDAIPDAEEVKEAIPDAEEVKEAVPSAEEVKEAVTENPVVEKAAEVKDEAAEAIEEAAAPAATEAPVVAAAGVPIEGEPKKKHRFCGALVNRKKKNKPAAEAPVVGAAAPADIATEAPIIETAEAPADDLADNLMPVPGSEFDEVAPIIAATEPEAVPVVEEAPAAAPAEEVVVPVEEAAEPVAAAAVVDQPEAEVPKEKKSFFRRLKEAALGKSKNQGQSAEEAAAVAAVPAVEENASPASEERPRSSFINRGETEALADSLDAEEARRAAELAADKVAMATK